MACSPPTEYTLTRPMSSPTAAAEAVAASARRKVAWRLLPLLLALYVVAYLDRANLGFAKLQMKEAEKGWFTDEVFGWGAGLFFIGYLVLEIPGALLVERWSARKWFARILVTWGVISMAMAAVDSVPQFYLTRFLLGLAEAGFYPGVIVYFTHWFPKRDRGRAMAAMILGVPGSLALGAPVSALLLKLGWFGLKGWQWLFLVEGAPAVALGVLVLFLLPDRPRDARWLTPAERDWLETTLEAERRETRAVAGEVSVGRVLRHPVVWLLAAGIFATNLGGYSLVFWLPTAVKGLFAADDTTVLVLTGVIYLAAMAGVWLAGQSSDRTGDRKWHCVAGQVGAAVFLTLAMTGGQPAVVVFGWLMLTGLCAHGWPTPFWALPSTTLTASAAAVAVGVINMAANLAGFVGNAVVGSLQERGVSLPACLMGAAACYALGGLLVAAIPVPNAAGVKA
jgi:ACS family tartrate transporter-like MFS transporter